jgi:hypothetical protein
MQVCWLGSGLIWFWLLAGLVHRFGLGRRQDWLLIWFRSLSGLVGWLGFDLFGLVKWLYWMVNSVLIDSFTGLVYWFSLVFS